MTAITKKRDLYPAQTLSKDTVNKIRDISTKVNGISDFLVNKNGSLHIEYDLLKINLQKIESIFKNYGIALNNSLLKRFKRGWIHFTEENEYANMTTAPRPCCNSDPTEKK